MMAEFKEELEPLFDYTRVQPVSVISLDDDELDDYPLPPSKRKKISNSTVEKVEDDVKAIQVFDCEKKDDEDWLPPPPKVSCDAHTIGENSTIKELRLKKQELASFARQSAEDVLQAMEESVKRELQQQSFSEAIADEPSKPRNDRAKIIISIQDKDGPKQFRIYSDDKFERLFKLYADKVKLDQQNLVFCFDGEKVGPEATPDALGMEDDDIIEVHVKPRL
ncbi:uncharacterized protein LOC107413329 [Ziziphus jujuba]|uniref:Uncharacterized protein LOC107413329 n=2 Tax=Ziziphus jujuba TaxID=326968 RepID=A0A6P3ZFI8_ZIZJJ|nr:uncharacterized protein LOC107413329 [Ziziphus jujuba]XP_015876737.1 uncharacterized protein LOC107413329 [Ziziphus jujuba]KAH7516455.1 hypothetical protein FEM48_Zijuj10G0137000 [Ziziphus jujuba var. spinosa]